MMHTGLSTAANKLDEFDPVPIGEHGIGVQRPWNDLQIALHGHLARIQAQLLDKSQQRPRVDVSRISVDLKPHTVTSIPYGTTL